MPTYEYRCAKCGEQLEVYQSFSDAPLTKHASCGGKLSKVMSPAGVILKGSGFYKTDSRNGSKSASKPKKDKESSSSSSSSPSSESSSSSTSSSSSGSSGSSNGSKSSDATSSSGKQAAKSA